MVLDPTRTFIGGLNPPTLSRRRRDKTKDFVGCINDVRFNGHLLHYYNGTNDIGNAQSIGTVNNVFVLIYLSNDSNNYAVYVTINKIWLFPSQRIPLAELSPFVREKKKNTVNSFVKQALLGQVLAVWLREASASKRL